jgi:hypothetical protein
MHNLLEKMKRSDAEQRQKNVARYRTLLEKGDSASEAEQTEIAELARTLGKNIADVEADLRAVDSRRRLQALVALEPEREAKMRNSSAAHKKLSDETERTINELKENLTRSMLQTNELERQWGESRRAANPLAELERKHWELFGLPDQSGTQNRIALPR